MPSIEIPSAIVLNEINRVLICALELSKENQSCTIKSVIDLCLSSSIGGKLINYIDVIKLCEFIGFINLKSGNISITSLGTDFLKHNPDYYYEITEKQKSYIAEIVLFNGPWISKLRKFLLNFSANTSKFTFEVSVAEAKYWCDHQQLISLLMHLGVLVEKKDFLYISPDYVAAVGNLRAEQSGKTEEELKAILLANEKLANIAEDAVIEYEKKRLIGLGRNYEASLVKKISKLNVNAGYDVLSFDGDKPELEHNRFIEVKTSVNLEFRFFWSSNERKKATQLGSAYWIYFIGGIKTTTKEIAPIMIQDPIKKLNLIPELKEEADRYVVTIENMLNFKNFENGQIKGFVL